MSADTSIEWTDKTWNPVRGCALVSDGCRSCYAMKTAHRFSGAGKPYEGLTRIGPNGPTWTGEIRLVPEALKEPLRWRKPQRIFVNSMSDLFHQDVPDAFIDQVFAVMGLSPQHTFQVLTKRAERMRAYCADRFTREFHVKAPNGYNVAWTSPLVNVWLGVSVENQYFAGERIPLLLQTPAAVRFVSAEPLLGPVDLKRSLFGAMAREVVRRNGGDPDAIPAGPLTPPPALDWVIVGGESGPGARPCALEWIEGIVQKCAAACVPCFVKQLGAYVVSEQRTMPASHTLHPEKLQAEHFSTLYPDEVWAWRAGLKNKKGGDPAEWPTDLRIRQFPEVSQ